MTTVKLGDGRSVPAIGLGTWQAAPGVVGDAVRRAVDCGYRHFDCARFYGNEREIGEALREKMREGKVKREDLFVVSKLWNTFHRPDLVLPACRRTLDDFGLDYLDLYLVHWPFAFAWNEDDPERLTPVDADGHALPGDVDYLDTWKQMEALVDAGLVRSIGLSNFNSEQIDRVLSAARIKPVVNQVEMHPYFNQKKLLAFCAERKLVITAYFPLGSPSRPWAKPEDPVLLRDPVLLGIAEKHGKTTAQVIFRYLLDVGATVVPKSSDPDRIKENIDVFDFRLSSDDIRAIDALDKNWRINKMEELGVDTHKHYPFHLEF